MAERPILFSGPLVRAILAGRKTETRRLIKPQPIADPNTGMLPTPALRPSIHMPKWAARIWLDVTEVRAERLQEIDDVGARAEGVEGRKRGIVFPPRAVFADLWNGIYGNGDGTSWSDNPWVWVIKFERDGNASR